MKLMQLFIAASLLATAPALADLKIVTTMPDFADVARQIGGDKVTAHSVMRGPENVHSVMATPTEMAKLNAADLFVHSGLDAEPWRDNLLKGARNPRVMPGRPGNVDMSERIELIEVPRDGRGDRSQGDMHAYGNPHYTTHPANAGRIAATLSRAMCGVDPDNAELYKANAVKFVNEMADLQKALIEELKPHADAKIVTYHKAWAYFADAFGLDIVGTVEAKIGISPSPAEMRRTIDLMKRQGVKLVIVETYSNYDNAKYVADAAGAQVIVLPDHVNGVAAADSYQNLFRHNVRAIIAALKD